MILRTKLVLWYILSCVRMLTPPWNYFQLNAPYFNETKGIFSKLELDELIPRRWRLPQGPLETYPVPTEYPVFVKPEWGQNAHGIQRVDNKASYLLLRQRLLKQNVSYLVQNAAKEQREFEFFYIRKDDSQEYAVLSAAEAISSHNERYPIHSVLNPNTQYADLCTQLSTDNLQQLWKNLNALGHFRIARIGIRANTLSECIQGNFHIIEINLFVPLPLRLLDARLGTHDKNQFIRHSMRALARATKALPQSQKRKAIFFRQVAAHYRIKS